MIRLARVLWSRATDLVLGARCPYRQYRVFPKDRCRYACAGDRGVRR